MNLSFCPSAPAARGAEILGARTALQPRHLPLLVGIFLGLAALPSALAQTPQQDRAPLHFGPLKGGDNIVVDWRGGTPNGIAILFLGLSGTPTPLPGSAAPALGVPVTSPFFAFATDASGRLRFDLPTVPNQFPAGTGLRYFAQALGLAANGDFILSNVAATALEPDPIAGMGSHFVSAAASLPAAAADFAGLLVKAGDLDGDGYADLVLSNEAELAMWRNNGAGGFIDASANLAYTGGAIAAMALADVDGDGRLDLVTGGGFESLTSAPNVLWRNQPDGTFALDLSFPGGDGQASDFGFGDFDGDGDLDLVVTSGPEGHLAAPGGVDRIYRNDGTGAFAEYDGFLFDGWNGASDRSTSVAVGDVDNDGDVDLFITKNGVGSGGAKNVLLLNLGDGMFVDITSISQPGAFADRSAHAVFVDLDLDGDLDIVTANSVMAVPTSASNDVWINQGGAQGGLIGSFVDDSASFLEPLGGAGIRLRVRTADVDLDGDPDVLVATHDFFPAAQQMLFLNQGGRQGGTLGVFERDVTFDVGGFVAGDVAIFDADGDGAPEMVIVSNGVLGGDPTGQFAVRYLKNLIP